MDAGGAFLPRAFGSVFLSKPFGPTTIGECGNIRPRGIRSSPPAAVDSDSPPHPLVWL